MWFAWPAKQCPGSPLHTVIVVDPGDSELSHDELSAHLAAIDDCLRHETNCLGCVPSAITAAAIVTAPHPSTALERWERIRCVTSAAPRPGT